MRVPSKQSIIARANDLRSDALAQRDPTTVRHIDNLICKLHKGMSARWDTDSGALHRRTHHRRPRAERLRLSVTPSRRTRRQRWFKGSAGRAARDNPNESDKQKGTTMSKPLCTTCQTRPAELYDDATGKAICAHCWLRKYPKSR